MFLVTLQPQGWTFEASPECTIRESAALADLELPSSCRNGTCRTCLCRLTAGSIRYEIEWPGLSAEEKAEGFILPCVAMPMADLVIEAPAVKRVAS